MYLGASVWVCWPALTISALAVLSGKGRSDSTQSGRRRIIMKKIPSRPPARRMIDAAQKMAAKLEPEALAADVDHHEGGDGEHGAGNEGFADGSCGASEVLLEDSAAEKRQAKKRNRNDGGGNRRRHGLAGFHPEVGVRRAEQRGHHQAGQNGFQGEFGFGRVVRDERFEGSHGAPPRDSSRPECST